MRIAVIHNPISGRRNRRRLFALLRRLEADGCDIQLHRTRRRGDAEAMARSLDAKCVDRVLAAGGDGTINEIVNGLTGSGIPLAVAPLGTANVLAGEIGLDAGWDAVADAVTGDRLRPVHLGSVGDRRFTMMAGVGFDAHVVAQVRPRLKRLFGKLAYVVESFAELWRYRPLRYAIEVDGVRYEAASAVIANGHYYAGRFVCVPEARLTEPVLHACLFLTSGRVAALRYAVALLAGRLHRQPDVRIVPCRRITVSSPVGEPIQADGDIIAVTPAVIAIGDACLLLAVPPRPCAGGMDDPKVPPLARHSSLPSN